MGIWVRYLNDQGEVCEIDDGRSGDLGGLLRNYHDCNCPCATCAERETIMDTEQIVIGPRDTLRFTHGSATGAELAEYAERQEAERVARRFVADGLGSYEEGYRRYLELHPGARARLAGVAQSPEDLLRRQGADKGYTVIDEGGTAYHVSGAPPKAEEQPDPDEGDVVTIVERGVGRYIVHGAIAAHAKPALSKPKGPEAARKELWRIANQLAHLSPFDAALKAILENPELLDTIVKDQ